MTLPARPLLSLAAALAAALLAVALLSSAGCDALRSRPGGDFAVELLGPVPIAAVGRVQVHLELRVTGCDSPLAEVGSSIARKSIALRSLGGQRFAADFPVGWLSEVVAQDCLADGDQPAQGSARIAVTCPDAGRTLALEVPFLAGVATSSLFAAAFWEGPARGVFPSNDPLSPLALVLPAGSDALTSPTYPLVEPRMAFSPAIQFSSADCRLRPPCQDVPVSADLVVPGVRLFGLAPGAYVESAAHVPAGLVDMAFAADGALVVLSQVAAAPDAGRVQAAAVTRVEATAVGDRHASRVVGYFPGERIATRFSRDAAGRLLFLAWDESGAERRSALHATDGETVDLRPDPTGDPGAWADPTYGAYYRDGAWLSPDGSQVAVWDWSAGLGLGPVGGPFEWLRAEALAGIASGAAWLPGAVALWRGTPLGDPRGWGDVEVFADAPGHPRRFSLFLSPEGVSLRDVIAVGDKLVLTTSTGVRVLASDGRLIGGADPLPCGGPTSIAAQTGPHHAAVGAGPYLYVWDLSTLDDAVAAAP